MPVLQDVPNTLTVGINKSNASVADSTSYGFLGGQQIIFRGENTRIDSIQIGNKLYGSGSTNNNPGGIAQPPTGGTGLIPSNGVFTLLAITGRNNEQLHYIKLEINGMIVEAGSSTIGDVVLSIPSGLPVTLGAIFYDSSQIYQLQFNIVT